MANLEGAGLPELKLQEVLAAAPEVVPDTLIVILYPLAQLRVRPAPARRQARDAAVDQPLAEVPPVVYAVDVILRGARVEDEPAAGVLVVQLPQQSNLGPVTVGAVRLIGVRALRGVVHLGYVAAPGNVLEEREVVFVRLVDCLADGHADALVGRILPVAAGPRQMGMLGELFLEELVESCCAGLGEPNHKDPGLAHGLRENRARASGDDISSAPIMLRSCRNRTRFDATVKKLLA